jgi:hypothetical protein
MRPIVPRGPPQQDRTGPRGSCVCALSVPYLVGACRGMGSYLDVRLFILAPKKAGVSALQVLPHRGQEADEVLGARPTRQQVRSHLGIQPGRVGVGGCPRTTSRPEVGTASRAEVRRG